MPKFKVKVVDTAPDGKSRFSEIKGPIEASTAYEAERMAISQVKAHLPYAHRNHTLSAENIQRVSN